MKIYLLIHEDRHSDPSIIPYKDRKAAVSKARERAMEAAKHYHIDVAQFEEDFLGPRWFHFHIEDIGSISVEEKELIE